jgi:serine/threonine protein kinase
LGAAKHATGTALLKTGTMIGSAEYTAPEQIRGKAVFASDLYSLGATCIHLLTQMSPFDLYDVSEGKWVWRDYLHHPVSDALGRILDNLLESATNRRARSPDAVLADLHPEPVLARSCSPDPTRHSSLSEAAFSPKVALLTSSSNIPARRLPAKPPSRNTRWVSNGSFPAVLLVLTLPVVVISFSRSSSPPPPIVLESLKAASPPAIVSQVPVYHPTVELTIALTDQSWVEVTVDGETKYRGVLLAGDRRTWTAQQQIKLKVGNAGRIKAALNQNSAQLLGAIDEIKEVTFYKFPSTSDQKF